ncbi:uncharacterized protein [Diadema setosum]|uniref:uncharacterized protein n=1 Tax=Diadema setosum TaxID=31175 RepID=UPI003B3AC354
MQQRQEQELCNTNSELPFFKPTSSSDQGQSHQQDFFMLPGKELQSTPSSATSLFKENTNPLISGENSLSALQFTSSTTFPVLDVPSQSQFLQTTSEARANQTSSMSTLEQQEHDTFEIQNQDKMNTLHSRLHHEADKIRRWKVQTEIEIRQKERSLSDAQQTIESQRKSLFELQLQNENLSVRLQEEMDHRIDISQKVVSTRDMCNLVKDYAGKLEDRLGDGERARDELQDVRQKQLEDMQTLEAKFQELTLIHSNKFNELKTDLHKEKAAFAEAEKMMTAKLLELEHECGDLQESNDRKKEDIRVLQEEMRNTSQQLALSQREKGVLKESLNQANEEVEANQQILTKVRAELKETISRKNQLQAKQIDMENEIIKLKQDAEESKEKHEKDCGKIQQLSDKMKKMEEAAELTEQQLRELSKEKSQLEASAEEQTKLLQKRETDVAALKDELKEVLEREKVSYDKLDSLRKDLQSESSENKRLVELIEHTRKEKHTVEQDLQRYKEDCEKLNTQITEQGQELQIGEAKLQTVLDIKAKLEKTNEELQNTHQSLRADTDQLLQEERDKNKGLEDHLLEAKSQKCTLEEKNKSLQGQVGQKSKQIKDLQHEVKSLKSQVTCQSNQKSRLEEQVCSLEKEVELAKADAGSVRDELAKLCEEKEEAWRKQSHVTAAYEEKIKEIDGVMDNYKAEYDKIVLEKDKTIDELKKKLLEEVAAKHEEEGKCKALEEEILLLKKSLADLESSSAALKEDIASRMTEIGHLEGQVKEKSQEIAQLKEDLAKHAEEEKASKQSSDKKTEAGIKTVNGQMNPKGHTHSESPHQLLARVPRTPVMGQDVQGQKALNSMQTPLAVVARGTPATTPQRGILKQKGSARLKRSVAFAQNNDMEDDGASSDSSTSQLMEFEVDDIAQRLRQSPGDRQVPSRAVTPLRVRPSPQVNQRGVLNHGKSPNSVQRSLTGVKVKMIYDEQQQLMEVGPPANDNPTENNPDRRQKATPSTKNARKTPKRAYKIKGWGDSPRGRKKKKNNPQKDAKENNLSWFESDAVYGFFD